MLGQRENISKLFSDVVQYKVPHYQRRYVWSETNWRTLWEDILAQLGMELKEWPDGEYDFESLEQREETSTIRRKGDNKKHFTGIIVIRPISKERGEPEIFEVIDGQQRLTTFQIILCVIRDILKSNDCFQQAKELQGLIMDESDGVKKIWKFIPTKYDELAFEKILEENYGNFLSQYFNEESNCLILDDEKRESLYLNLKLLDRSNEVSRDIFGVYEYFYKWIKRYVKKTENNTQLGNLFDLLSVIRANFDFAKLELGEEDYSEEIFESLNATGRKLSDFDYLRNNLFLRARQLDSSESKESCSDSFYRQYWIFEKDESDFHYWQTHRQEAFLRAFLKANLGPYCFSAENVKPLDVYRKYSMKANGIENEFRQLNTYAKSYQKLNNDMDNPKKPICRYVKFFSDLSLIFNDLSLTRLDPFILYVKHNSDDSAVDRVCKILESYLVRRMLCCVDEQNTYADVNKDSYICIEYLFNQSVEEGEFNVDEFKRVLSNHEWPDQEQVVEALKNFGAKRLGFIYYIFQRLEHYTKEKEDASWEFSPLILDEQRDFLGHLQKDKLQDPEILNNFNALWEPPPR